MRSVQIANKTRGTLIGAKIEVADTSLSRIKGLLGRRELSAGGGLWIRPSSGVHTIGMLFPIDVIGLDKSLRVIKLWNALAPFRVTSLHWRMHSVIELPAGQIVDIGTKVGDLISIT